MPLIEKVAVEKAVDEVYASHDLIMEGGDIDQTKIRELLLAAVVAAKVRNKGERRDKAITRGDLLATVVPKLGNPADIEDDDERELAMLVHKVIDQRIWGEVSPDANKNLQRMVGQNMGNGYVLCRTKVPMGSGVTDAAYITDDVKCIQQDFTRPDNKKAEAVMRRITANRELVIQRQPDHAKTYLNEYTRTLKAALDAGTNQLKIAIEAASNGDEPADDDRDEG